MLKIWEMLIGSTDSHRWLVEILWHFNIRINSFVLCKCWNPEDLSKSLQVLYRDISVVLHENRITRDQAFIYPSPRYWKLPFILMIYISVDDAGSVGTITSHFCSFPPRLKSHYKRGVRRYSRGHRTRLIINLANWTWILFKYFLSFVSTCHTPFQG